MDKEAARDLWIAEHCPPPFKIVEKDDGLYVDPIPQATLVIPVFDETAPHKDLIGGPIFEHKRWPTDFFWAHDKPGNPYHGCVGDYRKLNERFIARAYEVLDEIRGPMYKVSLTQRLVNEIHRLQEKLLSLMKKK